MFVRGFQRRLTKEGRPALNIDIKRGKEEIPLA
jgi:hypothetical protein